MTRRKHWMKNAELESWLGLLLSSIGAGLMYDAYTRRGRNSPLWMKVFPGA